MTFANQPASGKELSLPVRQSARILVAEDPFIISFLRTVLQRLGHEVTTGDPAQLCKLLSDGVLKVDLVITNSPSLFVGMASQVAMLYIAASPDPAEVEPFPVCRTLRKPFRNDELREAVDELLRVVVP